MFDYTVFGPTGDQEHVLARGVMFVEKFACAVIDGAESLAFAEGHTDVIRLRVRGGEGIHFVLGKKG